VKLMSPNESAPRKIAIAARRPPTASEGRSGSLTGETTGGSWKRALTRRGSAQPRGPSWGTCGSARRAGHGVGGAGPGGTGRAAASAAGRLDSEKVGGSKRPRDLRRQLLAVEEVPPPSARLAAPGARRCVAAPFREQ